MSKIGLFALVIAICCIAVLLAVWIVHLREEVRRMDEERLDMHDAFYAQWASAMGYRDMLLQQCNITINQTEPFEVYHSGGS